jgi:hypothetical protein
MFEKRKNFPNTTKHGLGFSKLFVSELKAAQSAAGLNFQLMESCSRMLLEMARILNLIKLMRLEDRPLLRGECDVYITAQHLVVFILHVKNSFVLLWVGPDFLSF